MHELFNIPAEDKLVYYYSCMYWKGRMPLQGWLYLTVNRLCFYAYIWGKEHRVVLRWAEVTSLSKTSALVLPDSIKVTTINEEVRLKFCKVNQPYIYYRKIFYHA